MWVPGSIAYARDDLGVYRWLEPEPAGAVHRRDHHLRRRPPMSPILFADNFLAGSVLSLVLPMAC